jgi:hypothetical protein
MATDKPISGLSHNPGVAAGDKIELVDVSNTSNNPTGENTYATVAEIVALASGGVTSPVMVASGPSHAAGLAPDPGVTSGTTKFLREDASWQVPPSSGGTTRAPIAMVTANTTAVANTTTPTSLFTGATIGFGSLTIPANRLVVGSSIIFVLFGDFGDTGGGTLTITVKLGSATVLTGVSGTLSTSVSGKQWVLGSSFLGVPVGGASATIRGYSTLTLLSTDSAGVGSIFLTTGGGGTASTPVTIDATGTLLFDVLATWSVASAGNTIRLLGGSIWIDG